MNGETIEIYLHGAGEPKVIAAVMKDTLRDVLARENALPNEGQFVFVGKAVEAIEVEDEDTHEPAEVDLTLEVLGVKAKSHVHTCAPRRIEVVVFYNREAKHRFPPVTTVGRVLAWAKRVFHVDAAAGADLILKLIPSGTIPRLDDHLADLLHQGQHELRFELVREVNPQG